MSNVIPFRKHVVDPAPGHDIDLLTAVDAAIRDLRDIAQVCRRGRRQADECRQMLERAYRLAAGEA